jgi:hypothetical protein
MKRVAAALRGKEYGARSAGSTYRWPETRTSVPSPAARRGTGRMIAVQVEENTREIELFGLKR